MRKQNLTVQYNKKISGGVYHMSLSGDCSEISRPGQFIDILIDDFFLRRPISIFDHDDEHVEILYRVVGGGTDALASKVSGDVLDVLLSLGNGFDAGNCGGQNLLVAGGIGMPPIHELAKQFMAGSLSSCGITENAKAGSAVSDQDGESALKKSGGSFKRMDFRVLLGFRSADDIFGIDAFRSLGIEPVIATEDGSVGIKGMVTDVMKQMKDNAAPDVITDAHSADMDVTSDVHSAAPDVTSDISSAAPDVDTGVEGFDYDYVFCCGPEPMLRAVYDHTPDGQFSFEERMGCGFGACMGCSCKTKYGYKRICKDGPVLFKDEILW